MTSPMDRSFEETYGHLLPKHLPKTVDWTKLESIQELLPLYRREFLKLQASGEGGKLSKLIEIDNFNLKTPYGARFLFKQTKLYLEPNKRCAVYGQNGSGKTSLFKAMASGSVRHFPKWMSVHHMKEMPHNPKAEKVSVMETVVSAHPELRVYRVVLIKLKNLIGKEKDEAKKAKFEVNLAWAEREYERLKGNQAEEEANKMFRVLGFDDEGTKQPMSALSGGLRMRVALASAFFINPDLLLLDEPTNHLDLPSVLWLENKLRGYKGSFLLVTHDRNLLENVVTSVYLLQDLQIKPFTCDFATFEKKKKQLNIDRDKMIDRFMKLNRNLDPTSPLYRTKMEYNKWQQDRLEREVLLTGKFTFKSPAALKAPEGVEQEDISLIKVENVRFSYGPERGLPFIFDNPISFEVKMNTRVGVMGPNGAGKSTFLKLITGKIKPVDGTITTNPDYELAYFGQHSTAELKMEETPFEFMCLSFPKANEGKLKQHLNKTSISDNDANTRMGNLSFSQRSCVIFAKLTFVPPHLLIMDEPTNFLDLDSVDSLIKAANSFKGALITVTHNRDFLKRCSRDFLSIVPGQFLTYETMKEAERATYSFITALENGEQVDAKTAIMQNRGGGAKHTDEYLEESAKARKVQEAKAKKKAAKIQAAKDLAAAELAEKEAKRKAKLALVRTDWKADEVCWAPVKKAWKKGVVKRNIPGMGVTVVLDTGKSLMIEAKKLRAEQPAESKNADKKVVAGAGGRGGRGGRGRGAGGRGARGGRGGRGGRGAAGGRGRR